MYSTFLCVYPQTHAEGMTKSCMTKRNRKSRLMSVMILVSYPQAVPLVQRRRRRRPPRYRQILTWAHVCSRVGAAVAAVLMCGIRAGSSAKSITTSAKSITTSGAANPRTIVHNLRLCNGFVTAKPRGTRAHEPSYSTFSLNLELALRRSTIGWGVLFT